MEPQALDRQKRTQDSQLEGTVRRRKAKLREQGLVVANAFFEPIEVDLGAVSSEPSTRLYGG
jgi:hypothetical protein